MAASQSFEYIATPLPVAVASTSHSHKPQDTTRFAPPKSDDEIQQARERAIPSKTLADTKYCMGILNEWRRCRVDIIPSIEDMSREQMQYWLTRFVLEVRKKSGDVYPPNTLHHIVVGIMRHVRWSGKPTIDFLKDPDFTSFRATLDAEMKRLQQQGIGAVKRQAEILKEDEEDILWEKGLLGDHTPQTLLDTMVFYNGLYFALRSGREHRQLRSFPCQIQLVERPGERPFLQYTEDCSKNHPGGLKGRNIKPKVVIHHSNPENPRRCFVRLFKLYRSLCPREAPEHAFYLRPSEHPTDSCWFLKLPLGHTKLSSTVARLCKSAGIEGYKTNHSLRATATSRLYRSGVDEQMVMERTGHRSLEGVRSYKRTSDKQREALSDILNQQSKHRPMGHSSADAVQPRLQSSTDCTSISTTDTNQTLSGLGFSSSTFNNCNITINIGTSEKKRKRALILDSESD